MRRALLCGYYGMGNGGDEALLATLLQMLPPSIKPLVLSAQPQATEKLHQVKAVNRWQVSDLMRSLKESDIFIWGGGSLMQDTTSLRNPIYYGGLMGLAQGMNLQTIAWAQGVGPLHSNLSRWITKRAFSNCNLVSVRDQGSAQLLTDWGIACKVAPDPVWALASTPTIDISDLPTPRIAVMLRSHPQLTAFKLNSVIQALQTLQQSTSAYILLIPFQPSKDLAIAEQIHSALPHHSKIITQSDPRQLKGIFQHVNMAIAMRYHGLIMAAAEGCLCSAISYDPKVSRLMSELNIPGWEVSELPDRPATIADAWIEQFHAGQKFDISKLTDLVNRALIHQELLAKLL